MLCHIIEIYFSSFLKDICMFSLDDTWWIFFQCDFRQEQKNQAAGLQRKNSALEAHG